MINICGLRGICVSWSEKMMPHHQSDSAFFIWMDLCLKHLPQLQRRRAILKKKSGFTFSTFPHNHPAVTLIVRLNAFFPWWKICEVSRLNFASLVKETRRQSDGSSCFFRSEIIRQHMVRSVCAAVPVSVCPLSYISVIDHVSFSSSHTSPVVMDWGREKHNISFFNQGSIIIYSSLFLYDLTIFCDIFLVLINRNYGYCPLNHSSWSNP